MSTSSLIWHETESSGDGYTVCFGHCFTSTLLIVAEGKTQIIYPLHINKQLYNAFLLKKNKLKPSE